MENKRKDVKKSKKPWPTKNAMKQIYEQKLWGSNDTAFYSGEGSHRIDIIDPYIEVLTSFLNSHQEPLTICDLGCGDFNVGKELPKYTKKYIAVDIVPDLIAYNEEKFKEENLEFHCLDIAKDDVPVGNCAILRQVLQHLSNSEIKRIVNKLYAFNYVIVTEHVPIGNFVPNKNIVSGQGIRLKKQSGVNLLAPPFNFKVKKEKQLTSFSDSNHKGVIRTILYEVF